MASAVGKKAKLVPLPSSDAEAAQPSAAKRAKLDAGKGQTKTKF